MCRIGAVLELFFEASQTMMKKGQAVPILGMSHALQDDCPVVYISNNKDMNLSPVHLHAIFRDLNERGKRKKKRKEAEGKNGHKSEN